MVRQGNQRLPRMARPSPLLTPRMRIIELQRRRRRRIQRRRALPRYLASTVNAQNLPHVVTIAPHRAGGEDADPVEIQRMIVELIREQVFQAVHPIRQWSDEVILNRIHGA